MRKYALYIQFKCLPMIGIIIGSSIVLCTTEPE